MGRSAAIAHVMASARRPGKRVIRHDGSVPAHAAKYPIEKSNEFCAARQPAMLSDERSPAMKHAMRATRLAKFAT